MKKIIKAIFFTIVLFIFGSESYSQTSTQGTEFWLSFGRNRNYDAAMLNLQLRIVTGSNAANVTLTYTQTGAMTVIHIPAGEVYTYQFTYYEKYRVLSGITGTTSNSLHIESDVPVSVYALNQYDLTADATNVLPVDGLGMEYYHISYRSNDYLYQDGYTLVATENGTNVYDNGVLATVLNKGQVYSAYFGASDATGRHITCNKPVAYFVTNGGVWLPYNTFNGADNLFQQLVSVNKWGRNFLVPVTHRGIERIRIVASQDGTVITQTGGIIRTDNDGYGQTSLNLNKGQFVELETDLHSCGCYITANNPVGVCSYLVGMEYHPPVPKGDPAMTWVPPIEQSITGALVAPFAPRNNSELDEHYALLVTPTATKNQTTVAEGVLPAQSLTGGYWCDNTTSGYSFYSIRLTNHDESYYFANPFGLTVMVYGIGDFESYYYLSGSASRNLDAAFYINDIHYQDLDEDILCDTTANFRALVQYAQSTTPGYLRWYIDGVLQAAYTDSLQWQKTLPVGTHTVNMKILNMDNDTVECSATFNVGISYFDTVNAVICLGERYQDAYNFDTIPAAAGLVHYSQNFTTQTGCDSIITLNLTVNPLYNDTVYVTVCAGESYSDENFNVSSTADSIGTEIIETRHFTTSHNCDSLITLHFTAYPVYNYTIDAEMCLGERYSNYNFDTIPSQAGMITVIQYLKTAHNCDSTVQLNLTVYPSYYDTIRAEICLGNTYSEYNFNETPTSAGTFYYVQNLYTSEFFCDSIVTLELTVNQTYNITIDTAICFGEHYYACNFDTIPDNPGMVRYSQHLVTTAGCDSIVTLNLTVNHVYYDTIDHTICLGEHYRQRGFDIKPNEAGFVIHKQDLRTVNNCDSIIILRLTINPSYYDTINAVICQSEIYDDYGFFIVPSTSGFFTYSHNEQTAENCDSITVLNLTVNPVYDEYVWATIYEDEFYRVGDSIYNTPGIHITDLQTIKGCDSIVNLDLSVIYYPSEITAFSPFNKDGINDYFMAGFKIQIFNRYGILVYETHTLEELNLGWDGKNTKGRDVEPGMYFYILYNSSGKPRIKSTVEVLKR